MFEQVNLQQILSQVKIIKKYEYLIKKRKHRKPTGIKINQIVRDWRIKNVDGAYNRALGNAVKHGACPVKCQVYIIDKGALLVVIEDSGKGFDYQSMIDNLRKGKVYYKHHGKGARTYDANKHSKVSFHNGGKTIAILYNL